MSDGNDPLPSADPYGDRAFVASRAQQQRGGAPRRPAAYEAPAAASDNGEDETPAEALRGDVLDLNRVDIDALLARGEKETRGDVNKWTPDELGLPPQCPVVPLGCKNLTFFFLTPGKEMVQLAAGNFGQMHVDALFAPKAAYLTAMWGELGGKGGNKIKVQYEIARRDLMGACARRGPFDPGDRVRGRGAWRGEDGELVMHFGDHVTIAGESRAPGLHGFHVYPAEPRLAAPQGDGLTDARAAAAHLLTLFKCWRWRRGDLDARLMLGWVIVSLMGAAVRWRPQIMLTGDAGMGKSTLQELLKDVLGERLVDVADATAAGLYQTLRYDALGVAFDEFENENEERGAAVMRLARLASSGGKVKRGGADGVPSNYEARGAFLFSAINPPSLRPAEQSRTTILALRPLTEGARAPQYTKADAAKIGAQLVARVMYKWPFWADRLDFFRGFLGGMGHSSRAQDQLGTLLAAADLALTDAEPHVDDHVFRDIETHLAASEFSDGGGRAANWRRCLSHVLGYQPDMWRATRFHQIGEALQAHYTQADGAWSESELRRYLAYSGIGLVAKRDDELGAPLWLAFPDRHVALAKVFEGTDWSARRGADGAWINALMQAPEDKRERNRFRLSGDRAGGVLVRMDLVLEADAGFE